LLVDAGPDVREQLLDAGASRLGGVLFTHDHADHCHGIDDLRAVFHAMRRPVDVWMHPGSRGIVERFRYVFEGRLGYPPTCTAHELPDMLRLGELEVRWFEQRHGAIASTGFRFDWRGRSVVYSTDVDALDETAFAVIGRPDLWIVDALRREPHPSHAHLALTLEWIERVRPGAAWLTHMDQSMDVAELMAELPAGVTPGWDGRVWSADA
jgi:phosphoribosyl 1,2-cyclic phosphate phosphodiesterase